MAGPLDRNSRVSRPSPSNPPRNGFVITPNDTTPLAHVTTAIYCGSEGTVVVDFAGYEDDPGATDVPFIVGAGKYLLGSFVKVKTATDAANLVGLY